MSREIQGEMVVGNFPPLVGLFGKVGNYVKGKVQAVSATKNNNPVVTLELIDLEGTTSVAKEKGVYEEVEVKVGDPVQVVGSVKQLKEKLPQLQVGDIVTITFEGKKKNKGSVGSTNFYKVIVE